MSVYFSALFSLLLPLMAFVFMVYQYSTSRYYRAGRLYLKKWLYTIRITAIFAYESFLGPNGKKAKGRKTSIYMMRKRWSYKRE